MNFAHCLHIVLIIGNYTDVFLERFRGGGGGGNCFDAIILLKFHFFFFFFLVSVTFRPSHSILAVRYNEPFDFSPKNFGVQSAGLPFSRPWNIFIYFTGKYSQ